MPEQEGTSEAVNTCAGNRPAKRQFKLLFVYFFRYKTWLVFSKLSSWKLKQQIKLLNK